MKLLISAKELFKGCKTKEEKKEKFITYGKWLANYLQRSLKKADFSVKGRVSRQTIRTLFGKFSNFISECGLMLVRRRPYMNNHEMKEHLMNIKTITKQGCWETDLKNISCGYQKIRFKGKNERIHRLSYYLFKRSIPDGMVIMHSCDNPRCFNPDHLSHGTPRDNQMDAVKKGRKTNSNTRKYKPHKIKDPYNYEELLKFVKENCNINSKNEWLYKRVLMPSGYASLCITVKGNRKNYYLHKLLLANKIGKKYEEIEVARHLLPNKEKPQKHDLNPDHLFEGTHSDNFYDAAGYSKSCKLTLNDVENIKKECQNAVFSEKGSKKKFDERWANKLTVHPDTIAKIRRHNTWNMPCQNLQNAD